MPLRLLGQVQEEGLGEQLDRMMDHREERRVDGEDWRRVEEGIAQPLVAMGLPYTTEQVQEG